MIYGKISDYKQTKNWISGSFFSKESVSYDENVEIKVDYFNESTSFEKHYHKTRKTWTIVIAGGMHMIIDGKALHIKAGEFVIYEPGINEELLGTDPGTVTVSIHSPSGLQDKIEE